MGGNEVTNGRIPNLSFFDGALLFLVRDNSLRRFSYDTRVAAVLVLVVRRRYLNLPCTKDNEGKNQPASWQRSQEHQLESGDGSFESGLNRPSSGIVE